MTKNYDCSTNYEYETPPDLFKLLDDEFHFTLDPCCTHQNAKCQKHYTIKDDGLSKSWRDEIVFMNPPYGRELPKWIKKAFDESVHATIVCLIPVHTDTVYWHEYIFNHSEIRFLKGRVHFLVVPKKAIRPPFAAAIVIYHRKDKES